MQRFIVIIGSAYTSDNGPYGISYSWDGEKFNDRQSAIFHGFMLGRSDDFNIGVLSNGRLTEICWMDQIIDADPGVLRTVAAEIGIAA